MLLSIFLKKKKNQSRMLITTFNLKKEIPKMIYDFFIN